MKSTIRPAISLFSCLAFFFLSFSQAAAQRQFGFDNRKSSGQPYLKPQETVKRFQMAPGYEAKLFAGEPEVTNPIAFTIDEKGRIWVVENFEYPQRTPKGQKPRDRIKILEDTDGDGKADKVTIWADGQKLPIGWDLASGIEVGHGGVFLGAAPYLFFLSDTDGDGRCDKQEILLKGFGSHDTHETLNTFQWGPDSKLYGLHGVFTQSKIGDVRMNAAVWRYDPVAKKFEIFAEGTSNPWGMDFDAHGQCHLACCVIPHLFHMIPGGTYIRQAGSSFNPYAYGLLPQSCDHTHHKESGWAHAGLLVMEGKHVPQAYRGSIIMGSIHGCSIKRDILRRAGSTYLAGHGPDFLVSGDKNFRPINIRWGPDGSIYVIDWHDQNPCHQAPKDSWDKTHGRIYRIQRKGHKVTLPGDMGKKSSKELVQLLTNDNPWWYRTALRLLHERKDKSVAPALEKMVLNSEEETHTLRALWGLYAIGAFDERIGEKLLNHDNFWLRQWAVRLLGEDGQVSPKMLARLTMMAKQEKSPEVRLQLACTAQRLKKQNVLPMLHNLMQHKSDAKDRFIPLMLWLAYEPRVSVRANPALEWLQRNAAGNALVTEEIVPRTMRRLASTGKKEDLAACISFLGAVHDSAVRRQALQGLTTALKNRQVQPPGQWRTVFASLLKEENEAIRQLARKLAINFQDKRAIRLALQIARNKAKNTDARVDAIQDLALAQPKEAQKILLDITLNHKDAVPVRVAACRALASFDDKTIPSRLLAEWKKYPAPLKGEAVQLLSGRKNWATVLLNAVANKRVARTELSNNHILRIRAFRDAKINEQIEKVWGKYRETPAELNALIKKMRVALAQKRGSFERGRKVFENNCAKCHTFEGKGHKVGPELDGAGRDIEYLLTNVLDPNRVVGQPYYTRLVLLKNGRVETGLLVSEEPQSITLKGENDALKTILRKDIDGKILVQTKSVMPEGLANNMTAQDFRDLVTYVMAHPFLTNVMRSQPLAEGKLSESQLSNLADAKLQWSIPRVSVTGRIVLPKAGKENRIVLIKAKVEAASELKTKLQIGAVHPVRIWLNGKVIYNGKPGSGLVRPDQIAVPAHLQAGTNRILIEVTYRGDDEAIYARFHDPDRLLRYPETARK